MRSGRSSPSGWQTFKLERMRLALFDYDLPPGLIAQEPPEPRDRCRLLVLNRQSEDIKHLVFRDIVDLLGSNDVLVVNDTKVIPARLLGTKTTGGRVELLLTHQRDHGQWEAISKPGLKPGTQVQFGELKMVVLETLEDGLILVDFNTDDASFWQYLDLIGHTPLPPYIKSGLDELKLRSAYQTLYAAEKGSVAAPTAGFHFTPEVFAALTEKGVELHRLTLHVSLGTFRPVKTEDIESHTMHPEWYSLSRETAVNLNQAKKSGKRIVAVGTTTTRVLESCTDGDGVLLPGEGETKIFIYPPYQFKFVDALVTNFHLPKSTLLMLISALVSYPNTNHRFTSFAASAAGKAYREAIEEGYKFYSFGDAMFIE